MKLALIGHRGVGKSSLLQRIETYLPQDSGYLFLSLDREIEIRKNMSIAEIFQTKGENYFRELEEKIFQEIVRETDKLNLVIDIGAGFLGSFPKDWKCLWVKRRIDSSQSIFLNRPNLDQSLRMNAERFSNRENRYAQVSDFELELLEQVKDSCPYEKKFFLHLLGMGEHSLSSSPWYLTVLENRQDPNFLKTIHSLTGCGFELRDDLLTEESLDFLAETQDHFLLSFRNKDRKKISEKWKEKAKLWDWPLEWGNEQAPIVSLHQRKNSLLETLNSLEKIKSRVKLAVPIENFNELKMGMDWYSEDPANRIFLPSSAQGRWKWFRLLQAHKMGFGFFKTGEGSGMDQPQLLEVLRYTPQFSQFAAILGSPISHSLTPSTHDSYFKSKRANIVGIDISEQEWEMALDLLTEMGLRWSAVTSPLKKKAFEWVKADKKIKSINTLVYVENQWKGTNTDLSGIMALKKWINEDDPVVWGGGGTLDVIKEVFPEACFYSSRTGLPRNKKEAIQPRHIIWAVGAQAFACEGLFPPSSWKPQAVVDLNYTQDSPGISCAYNYGCQYHSGLDMFLEQAKKQQEFWNQYGSQ